MTGLDTHNLRVREDLKTLGYTQKTWVPETPDVYDVVIVGGGQSGLSAAFALKRERIHNILILDENSKGFEGPWTTYARMITLRTPKELLSIEMGVPSLAFRSYWIAQNGEKSYDAIGKISRLDWAAYLVWYRDVLDLPVRNDTKLLKVNPTGQNLHELDVSTPHGPQTIKAKKVVFATGIQGGGEWHTPGFIKDALPKSRYAHTSEMIDYAAMKGKKIAILGGGASAFDNAQHALGQGVHEAHVFMRRPEVPKVNPIRFMENTGVVPRFASLDDETKYTVISSFFARSQPPTNDTFQRATAWSNFYLHLGSPWTSVEETNTGARVTTPRQSFTFDFLVLSTGVLTDSDLRSELSEVSDKIARWHDVFTSTALPRNKILDAHPYLGDGFEMTAKTDENAPFIHGLFAFNFSALVSLGLSASALTGLGYALPKLARGVADQLFLDEKESWTQKYLDYDDIEFTSDWTTHTTAKSA